MLSAHPKTMIRDELVVHPFQDVRLSVEGADMQGLDAAFLGKLRQADPSQVRFHIASLDFGKQPGHDVKELRQPLGGCSPHDSIVYHCISVNEDVA